MNTTIPYQKRLEKSCASYWRTLSSSNCDKKSSACVLFLRSNWFGSRGVEPPFPGIGMPGSMETSTSGTCLDNMNATGERKCWYQSDWRCQLGIEEQYLPLKALEARKCLVCEVVFIVIAILRLRLLQRSKIRNSTTQPGALCESRKLVPNAKQICSLSTVLRSVDYSGSPIGTSL